MNKRFDRFAAQWVQLQHAWVEPLASAPDNAAGRQGADLLHTTAHELRAPLSSIIGYSEFLEDEMGGPLTPEQRTYVVQIQDAAQRLRSLVDDLLDFARLESGKVALRQEPTDLNALVHAQIRALKPQALGAGVHVAAFVPPVSVHAAVDPGRIAQVLVNLLTNALRHTPPGGAVDVNLLRDGDHVRFEVADTGPGIPAEAVPRLFEKFYQVDPHHPRGGAGLGLAICQALVSAHGGEIGVTSEPGAGATFWFTLPIGEG